ncbi:uncharacterized protein LOC116202995 isoform X1 [Punica granatum]|uniref:Uncharacterized protein LOC116202995 isoform X1 n=3 Tax=Punica granatum TaxID=22663 RepID=A0A6P8DGJ2_PUNGR|nr:uncharacterized protein LOC116202995 isoform X1 [Punica granatum]
MDIEAHEMSIGWPLGLEIMNSRLGVVESIRTASAETRLLLPSASFSSFTSSALDTESSASFFHDSSRSLGWLTGIKPGNGGRLYFPGSRWCKEVDFRSIGGACSTFSKEKRVNASKRICIPLLQNILVRASRNKNKSKR